MSRFVVRPGTPSLDIRRRPATAQAVTSKRAIHIESPVPQVRPTPMFAKFSNASNPEFEERKAKLDTLYENVSSMLEMIHSIVEKNSHSPECVTFFNSFYKTMKSCLPKFMKESTKYFRAEADLKVNTTKTCVLSAKAMIPSAKIFASAWSNFKVQLSDSLTNYKPPQTSTILVLFESIKTDFHNILIANKNRKNASNSIKEIIESVELLCNTLMNNISNVFERNIGEDFSSNLCNTLQTDVRSFLSIVMKYFNSDFKISGISIPDLKRSKGSVQANGNAIIILIKNAFDFSKDVKEIQKRMSNYEPQLNEIFEVIEMPFIVIKPLYKSQTDNSFIVNTRNSIKNNSVLSNTLNNGLDDSLNHSSFIEYVDDKEDDLFDELSNSVRAFFDQMGIVFDTDWSKTPLLQGLEDIANCVNNALLEYKEMAQNIEYLERQARVDKIKIEEFQKGDLKVTSLNAEIFELKMRIKEKEKEIEELKEIPDPYPLRDALLKLGQMFALKYKMNFNCDQETDCDEIIDTFENIIKEGPKIESETEKIEKVINKLKKITKIEDQNLDEQLLKADQAVSEIIQENENLKQQILLATQKLETSLIKAKVDIPKEKNLDAFVEALDTKILSLINLLKKKTRDFANDQIEYKGYLTKIHYILSNKEVEDNPDQICKTIINNLKKWKNDMEDKDQTIQNKESEVKAQALKLSRFLKFIKKLIEIDFTEYDGIETYQFAIQNEINSLRGKNELLNIKINEINKHLNTYSEKLNFDPNDSVISKIELIINQFNDQNSLIAGLEEENENIRKTLVATTNSLGRLLPTATIVSWETKIDDLMKIADSLAISPDASKPVIQKEKVNEILGYSEGDAEANLRAIAVRIKINDSSMKVMNQFNNAFHEISNSLRSSQGNGFASLMGSVAKMSSLFSGLNPSLADQITYSFLSQSVSLVEAMSRHILDFHQ